MENGLDVKSLAEACKQVDLFTFCNWRDQTVYFIYQDERTLDINQEFTIRNLIKERLPDYKVVFAKCRKENSNV